MNELFDHLEIAAWGGFIATQSRVFQRIEDDLRKRFGVTHAEFEVLLRLSFAAGGRKRIQELAAQSLLSRSGTSRAVDRLTRAGYVVREGAEEDGRGAYAVLSARGRAHFREAARAHVELVRAVFLSHFTEAELTTLAAFWSRIRAADAREPAEEEKRSPARAKPKRARAAASHAVPSPGSGRAKTTRRTRG